MPPPVLAGSRSKRSTSATGNAPSRIASVAFAARIPTSRASESVATSTRSTAERFGAWLPVHSLRNAVSGALLMDLAFNDRIDTDLHQLYVIDSTPLDEPVLDPVLARIVREREDRPTGHWVRLFAAEFETVQPRLLDRLVSRGILAMREDRLLWVLGSRRYPTADGRPLREVKRRIMDVLLSETIPDPKDIAIICLADACALWLGMIHERELVGLEPRIAQVVKLDLIGQSVAATIRELQDATRGEEARWFS